jgi:uncharacterized phage protein gp47/JayE
MTWGLSIAGFKPKTFDAIKQDIESELKNTVDPNLRFTSDTVAGQLSGIVANQARQAWETLSSLYHSLQPDTASGRALDALCSLTGTYRKRARPCNASAIMTLDSNVTLPKDSRIRTVGGDFFKTIAEITNKDNVQTDMEVAMVAEELGPIMVPADTKADIMTPSAGWIAAKVKEITKLGRLEESDDELRLRRIRELKANGSSTFEALKAILLQLEGVQAVYIKEQQSSFEVIVHGGKDEEIAQTIWLSKPLGIETIGQTTCAITDSINQARAIRFTRPKVIALSLHANLKVRTKIDDNELDLLKNALVSHAIKHFQLGAEVYPSRFFTVILDNSTVLDILTLHLRDRISAENAPNKIDVDQIASLSFNDIHIEQIIEVPQ